MEECKKKYKYKAFISYSHKDIRFARWLQKKIENYKIPKSLREKYPNLPKDLKRSVFRDEEELPTDSNLPDNLTNALEQSKILIVICSPNSVGSEWVNKEIAYFKSYHGEERVLAIIKDGEPNAIESSLEAFPKALRYKVNKSGELTQEKTEPIAGDARKFFGRKRGLIKLIAGILKVNFADLWEREKREQLKRRVIKTFFAFLLFGAVGFGVIKYQENTTIKGYGIDYMKTVQVVTQQRALLLTDISDEEKNKINKYIKKLEQKLLDIKEATKAISKIDGAFAKEALRILNTKGAKEALVFIDSKESIDNEEQMLVKLANKHRVRANIYIANQKYNEAILSYEKVIKYDFSYNSVVEYAIFLYKQNSLKKAVELYQKLLKKRLSKEQKAGVFNNLANLQKKLDDNQKAMNNYQEALKLKRELANENPSAYNNSNVAMTLNNLADLQAKLNQNQKAMRSYQEALKLRKELANKNPSVYNFDLAGTLNNLANLQEKLNQNQKAMKNYEEALKLKRELANKNPSIYNFDVTITLNNIANLQEKLNQNQNAIKNYQEALKLRKVLANENPFAYNPYVANILNNLSNLQKKLNQNQEALKNCNEALKLYRILNDKNPFIYNSDVAKTLNNLANLQAKLNQNQEAMMNFQETLKLYRALANKNPSVYNFDLAGTLNNLANLQEKLNQNQKAMRNYQKALKLRKALADKNPSVYNSYVANTLNSLAILQNKLNQNQKALTNYKEALKLYRILANENSSAYNSYVAMILHNLALLQEKLNQNQKARKNSQEALRLYRILADKNPSIYTSYVANTLNSLAILQNKLNQNQEALKNYKEALKLYRVLTNENPSVYGILFAQSLIIGVDMFNQPVENLDEAEIILQKFRGISNVEWLLGMIEKFPKKFLTPNR